MRTTCSRCLHSDSESNRTGPRHCDQCLSLRVREWESPHRFSPAMRSTSRQRTLFSLRRLIWGSHSLRLPVMLQRKGRVSGNRRGTASPSRNGVEWSTANLTMPPDRTNSFASRYAIRTNYLQIPCHYDMPILGLDSGENWRDLHSETRRSWLRGSRGTRTSLAVRSIDNSQHREEGGWSTRGVKRGRLAF